MLFKRTLLDAKIKMAISRIFINSNKFCNNSISKSVVVFSNSASFHTSRFRSLEKEPHIIKSRFEDVPLSKQPFSEFLWSNSEKFSQRTSLVNGITGHSLTFEDSAKMVGDISKGLRQMGAKKGEVIGMFLPNCVEFPVLFSGATDAGMAVTTMNPIYTATEIARQLTMSKATWVATNKELLPVILDATARLSKIDFDGKIILTENESGKGCITLDDVIKSGQSSPDLPKVEIDVMNDMCALPYSSGTTGLPKGVMLTHFNLVANGCQQVWGAPEIRPVSLHESSDVQPVTLCILPLYHIYALNVTMTSTLHIGGQLVMLPKFEPKSFINALEKYKPTFLHLAPPLLAFCADHEGVRPDALKQMHHVMTAAAPTGANLVKRFQKKVPGCLVKEAWGMSETSPIGLMSRVDKIAVGSCGVVVPNTECKIAWGMSETSPMALMSPINNIVLGSCGVPVPNSEFKIVDVSTGDNLPENKIGELCIRGPQIMKGYLDNEKATEETIKKGWLHTGDIAYHDSEGNIFITDRLKELIKVKGFQVPPAELEDLLRGNPEVADVAVIGIPHERFGEAPRAYIVKKPDSNLTEQDVVTFVAQNTASYKHLVGGVEFISAVPKSNSGKILRKELKAKYESESS